MTNVLAGKSVVQSRSKRLASLILLIVREADYYAIGVMRRKLRDLQALLPRVTQCSRHYLL